MSSTQTQQFGGETYNEQRDGERLTSQLDAVRHILSDGQVWTLYAIATQAELILGRRVSTPGVSARIRDLRKEKFGGLNIEKLSPTTTAPGVWRYQMKETA